MELVLRQKKGSKVTKAEGNDNLKVLKNNASLGGLVQNPKESIVNEFKNKFINLKQAQGFIIDNSIDGGYVEITFPINYISDEDIFGIIEVDLNGRVGQIPIELFDEVVISGSSIPSNNGTWKINFSDRVKDNQIALEQNVNRKLSSQLSPLETKVTIKARKIIGLSYPQAQLQDGTLIWEAYDNQNFDGDEINGYWVALKPNGNGEYEYISHLKMSENFWNYWYEYTVKVEGEQSVILTTLTDYLFRNVGSIKFKLSIVDNQLVLEETIYDLGQDLSQIFYNLTGFLPSDEYSSPYYVSDNDWCGMMSGPEMGWYWIRQSQYFLGYNMLTGEIKLIDISESIFNIKNINSSNLEGESINKISFISHSKYGLLLIFNSGLFYPYGGGLETIATALWSPNFTNIEYATILDGVDGDGQIINRYGNLTLELRCSINLDYIINFWSTKVFSKSDDGITIVRKKLDDPNSKNEYIERVFGPYISSYYDSDSIYFWEREQGIIISFPIAHYAIFDFFISFRNDKTEAEYIQTMNMYPNMIEDDKVTNWDRTWYLQGIQSLTSIYNDKTF